MRHFLHCSHIAPHRHTHWAPGTRGKVYRAHMVSMTLHILCHYMVQRSSKEHTVLHYNPWYTSQRPSPGHNRNSKDCSHRNCILLQRHNLHPDRREARNLHTDCRCTSLPSKSSPWLHNPVGEHPERKYIGLRTGRRPRPLETARNFHRRKPDCWGIRLRHIGLPHRFQPCKHLQVGMKQRNKDRGDIALLRTFRWLCTSLLRKQRYICLLCNTDEQDK